MGPEGLLLLFFFFFDSVEGRNLQASKGASFDVIERVDKN